MADASTIRKASTLMTASGRNEGAVRYNTTTRRPVWSNGQEWINFGTETFKQIINYNAKVTAAQVTKPFFVATKRCKVNALKFICETGETTATTLTMKVTKETGTVAPGGGLMLTTANWPDPVVVAAGGTCVAATVQTGTLISATEELWLDPGDRLSVYYSAASNELAGVNISVELESYSSTIQVTAPLFLNADVATDRCIFVAGQQYRLVAAKEVHAVLGTDAGAVVMQLTKENTATTLPGAGTDMLSNTSNTGFNLKSTINTPQSATFKTTAGLLNIGAGDRISFDVAGTPTAVAGVVVTLELQPLTAPGTFDIALRNQTAATDQTDEVVFIATSPCVVLGTVETHQVLGTDVGAVNAQVTHDTGTNAAGAGTNMLSDNANAGYDLKAAVETPQTGTLAGPSYLNILDTGDRIAVDYAGTITALAGVVTSVRVQLL